VILIRISAVIAAANAPSTIDGRMPAGPSGNGFFRNEAVTAANIKSVHAALQIHQ